MVEAVNDDGCANALFSEALARPGKLIEQHLALAKQITAKAISIHASLFKGQ
ncbi:MAG: hypothetical protein ACRCYU_03275 [Nocardioides sp.]